MKKKEMAELFKTIADSFTKLSELCSSIEDAEQPKPTGKKEKPDKAAEPSPVEETATEEKLEPVTYTKEDVRAKLAQKAKADGGKYKGDVKGIVAKFSSDGTLTGVPADKYSELVAELEVVGNA